MMCAEQLEALHDEIVLARARILRPNGHRLRAIHVEGSDRVVDQYLLIEALMIKSGCPIFIETKSGHCATCGKRIQDAKSGRCAKCVSIAARKPWNSCTVCGRRRSPKRPGPEAVGACGRCVASRKDNPRYFCLDCGKRRATESPGTVGRCRPCHFRSIRAKAEERHRFRQALRSKDGVRVTDAERAAVAGLAALGPKAIAEELRIPEARVRYIATLLGIELPPNRKPCHGCGKPCELRRRWCDKRCRRKNDPRERQRRREERRRARRRLAQRKKNTKKSEP